MKNILPKVPITSRAPDPAMIRITYQVTTDKPPLADLEINGLKSIGKNSDQDCNGKNTVTGATEKKIKPFFVTVALFYDM